jgi:FAD/FMN-containing dehydrogenase
MADGIGTRQIEARSEHGATDMSFRITGLPAERFAGLFSLSDQELAARGALRRIADGEGYPCRISLTDAEPGQVLILTHFEHQPADTPYRASHAIYVRAGEKTYDAVDQVPEQLRRRLLSLRAFDGKGMMVGADVVDGRELEGVIDRLFADQRADYLHVHYAKPGCYAARVDRA